MSNMCEYCGGTDSQSHDCPELARRVRLAKKRLPVGWEIRRRADIRDGHGRIPAWAVERFYVLDGRTDVVACGKTPLAAVRQARKP
jgi:hypothetical protein